MNNKQKSQPVITIPQAKEALLRSGYLLESRIESFLREKKYFVEANSMYTDPQTQKSREIDLTALKPMKLFNVDDNIFPSLVIECINNPQPIAFLTKEPQTTFDFHNDLKFSGLPIKLYNSKMEGNWETLSDFLNMEKYCHYCKGRISTQYCSFSLKKNSSNEWLASHEESHFDSTRKLCDAVSFYSKKHFLYWNNDPLYEDEIEIRIYYSIIIVQGELLEVYQSKEDLNITNTNHIHFIQPAIIKDEEEIFHIDIVTESYFPQLCDIIEEETKSTVNRLKRKKEQVYKSTKKIVQQIKKAKNDEQLLEAMLL
jgi:hypothetical protein